MTNPEYIQTPVRPEYLLATAKLLDALNRESIPYEVAALFQGFIIGFPSLGPNRTGDVILHNGSYGPFEGYGEMSPIENDIYIFDGVDEVVEHAKKIYKAE